MSAEDRKVAIVKAAMPLFARKGFAETTTKDLAKAAGVSEPLIYKHFPSKEALYVEIQNHSCNGIDPVMQRLNDLKPSTSTLVHLVYFLMRALVLGRPAGTISWDTRHRLMLKSLLEDGAYARSLYNNRFEHFCSRMEACLDAATAAGDVVKSPVSKRNRAYFAQNFGAWLAILHLPGNPPIDYKVSSEALLDQAVSFTLRGMGVTDKALKVHYNPKALALSFGEV
ncbi:MAG: transcriptional regulator [Pedosphaera sp.]|nr:transcriptional regulator [Pedosphaera sp.]